MSSVERPHPFAESPGLTTARVADTLDELGRRAQVCEPVLRSQQRGSRTFGRAVTVSFEVDDREDSGDDPYGSMIALIDGLVTGDVVMIAAGGDDRTACWGQLFSAAAQGHGAHGVVCDGYVRDIAEIGGLGFPVFARGSRPVDYRNRLRIADIGATVTIAGVPVEPDDMVLADDDGVVIIPHHLADDVAALAATRVATEGTVLTELLNGSSLRDVWDRHGTL